MDEARACGPPHGLPALCMAIMIAYHRGRRTTRERANEAARILNGETDALPFLRAALRRFVEPRRETVIRSLSGRSAPHALS